MNSAVKAHPLNNGTLIVYFVGGITSYEMKIVKEMFSKEKDFNVNSLFRIIKHESSKFVATI